MAMPLDRALRRAGAPAALLLVVAAGASAVPADAATGGRADGAAQRTVTLTLRAGALTPVVGVLSSRARTAALDQLLPTGTTTAAAQTAVARLGLTVTAADAQSLTVSGSAAAVTSAFGSGTATRVPLALQGSVLAALPEDDPTVWRSRALSGADLDAAYASPVPGGYPTSAPSITATTPIVATIQLSGWDASDLTTFAGSIFSDGYDPVASGQYTAVGVDRSPAYDPSNSTDASNGNIEVALDQEALLAAAPRLRERAYFATQGSGIAADYQAVVADVVTNHLPIAALSTSWGACEHDAGAATIASVTQSLQQLTAAGVTVFAASGDAGAGDDCSTGTAAVDFPASSPYALGVGGTTHGNGAGAPAPDTTWNSSSSGSSGGGTSTLYATPSWQSAVQGSGHRQVPDLASDADPTTGVTIVYTDHSTPLAVRRSGAAGGTSLSAPLSAAQLVDAEVAHTGGCASPAVLGDIHVGMYAARFDPAAVIDVATATPSGGNAPPTTPGYDTATGVGTPQWTALVARLYGSPAATTCTDSTPPVLSQLTVARAASSQKVMASWSGYDQAGGSGVVSWQVTVTTGGRTQMVQALPLGSTSSSFTGAPGKSYSVSVLAIDGAGLRSAPRTASTTLPLDERAATRSAGWTRYGARGAYAGTLTRSAKPGATLSATLNGRKLTVLVTRQRSAGRFQLLLDGKLVRTVDAGLSKTQQTIGYSVSAKTNGRHKLTVRVLAARGARGGVTTYVDGFSAS